MTGRSLRSAVHSSSLPFETAAAESVLTRCPLPETVEGEVHVIADSLFRSFRSLAQG
jgi:hypothetical protein